MTEYEIHVSASYKTSGGTIEWNCFTEYVEAESEAAAKAQLRAELRQQGYRKIIMDAIEARHDDIVARWMRHFDEVSFYC